MRSYRAAVEREKAHSGLAVGDRDHQADVLSSVVSAAGFLEAMVNELFQDAADGHGVTDDGYLAPLSPRTHELMREWWLTIGEGFDKILAKYQLLLVFGEKPTLDAGAEPYQSAAHMVRLRNAIVHYRPETVYADEAHRLENSLRDKFADNALMAGAGNPWWPSHALGAGCAGWSIRSAKALADRVAADLGISPNYQRTLTMEWP